MPSTPSSPRASLTSSNLNGLMIASIFFILIIIDLELSPAAALEHPKCQAAFQRLCASAREEIGRRFPPTWCFRYVSPEARHTLTNRGVYGGCVGGRGLWSAVCDGCIVSF